MALNFCTASEGKQDQTHVTLAAPLRDVQGALPAPSEHSPREVTALVPGCMGWAMVRKLA